MATVQIKTKTGNVIEVALEDIVHFFANFNQELKLKGPSVLTSFAALVEAADKVAIDAAGDVSNPATLINIPMDIQQFTDVKAVVPEFKTLLSNIGIKI